MFIRGVVALNQLHPDSSFQSPHFLLLEEMGNLGMAAGPLTLTVFSLRSLFLGCARNSASTIPRHLHCSFFSFLWDLEDVLGW